MQRPENQRMQFKKTRLAPTPSGFLHLGNVLSFGLTAALAFKTGAKILLRIDDLDRERLDSRYVQDIFDTLRFLGIQWDEGPENFAAYEKQYSQLHRLDQYKQALQQLRDSGYVYACSCSRAEILQQSPQGIYSGTCRHKKIPLDTENVSWRLYTAGAGNIIVKTLRGNTHAALPADMHDFIVKKKDGFPAYQLSSVVDDVYFGIDLVVRGLDLWPSTLAQLYLAALLGYEEFLNVTFHHHPLLPGPQGNKLSKSAGDTSIQFLRRHNKTPEEIYQLIPGLLHKNIQVSSLKDLETAMDNLFNDSR